MFGHTWSRLAGRRAVRYPSQKESDVPRVGTGMPHLAASETTSRQAPSHSLILSLNHSSTSSDSRFDVDSNASLILPRNVPEGGLVWEVK